MPVLAIDLALVRDVLLPDLKLTVGRALMARVVDPGRAGQRGTLAIAGYTLGAELPRDVRAGQELRLEVRDVDAHRVLFGIADRPPAQAPAAPPAHTAPAPIALPGGVTLRVVRDESEEQRGRRVDQRGGSGSAALALRLDGAALGAIDLRFELDPATLRVEVSVARGEPLERARSGADALRSALSVSAERPVSVAVIPRRDPLDVYA